VRVPHWHSTRGAHIFGVVALSRLWTLALYGTIAGLDGCFGGALASQPSLVGEETSNCIDASATYTFVADAGTCTYSQVVGPSGGTVTAPDGTTVLIPAGALAHDVTITITLNPSAPALTQAQPLFYAHLFGPEGQHFLKAISVKLFFAPTSLPPGATVQSVSVYTAPADSSSYLALATSLTDATHVTAKTTDFCNMVPGTTAGGGV
jgi:hypothetical protein